MKLNELRSLIRSVIREEIANKEPDNTAHQELAKSIVQIIQSVHSQEKDQSVAGVENIDIQNLSAGIRDNNYFALDKMEYKWDEIWKVVLGMLQKDYQQKMNLSFQLIENLKTSPSLGDPLHTEPLKHDLSYSH